MNIQVFGLLHYNDGCEYRSATRPFDPVFLRRSAEVHDRHGFDRVLIGQHARSPDPLSIAASVIACTERLNFMIAHRPGFIAPTMAARMFATLDRLSAGRCAPHIISAASDIETRNDGDYLTKERRYERSGEYVGILRKLWGSESPLDHEGAFYAFRGAFTEVRPPRDRPIPIFWGGASPAAVTAGAACADVYAMGGATLAAAGGLIAAVRAAAPPGRHLRFCMSLRIIMGATEEDAWRNAYHTRDRIVEFRAGGGNVGRDKGGAVDESDAPTPTESDPCLWEGLKSAVQGRTHITALVGTPAQLTQALLRYNALGIDHFILTGFEPLEDCVDIGRELIPRLARAAA